jgi:hypothetical protein
VTPRSLLDRLQGIRAKPARDQIKRDQRQFAEGVGMHGDWAACRVDVGCDPEIKLISCCGAGELATGGWLSNSGPGPSPGDG